MKNERLMSAACACGWFGAYLLISIIATMLPDGIDVAVTILALWGLIFICTGKGKLTEKLAYGGIKRCDPKVLLFSLCAGAGLNLAFSGLLPMLPLPEGLLESYTQASSQYEAPGNILMFRTVFLVPVLEETVFRGLIGERLGKALPKWLAIPAASLVFAVMHGNILWISYAFLSGLLLMWLYFKTDSILPCIAFHMMFNAANYLWVKILPLPDETWSYLLSLTLGAAICSLFMVLIMRKSRK